MTTTEIPLRTYWWFKDSRPGLETSEEPAKGAGAVGSLDARLRGSHIVVIQTKSRYGSKSGLFKMLDTMPGFADAFATENGEISAESGKGVEYPPHRFTDWVSPNYRQVFSGTASVNIRALERSQRFRKLKDRIRGFAGLEKGWDSYDGEAPTEAAVSAALWLVSELEKRAVLPEWVTPTSDSGILMQFFVGNAEFKWEFDAGGDVAVMERRDFSPANFLDLNLEEIPAFLAERIHE